MIATDQAGQGLSSEAQLTIQVEDINDNSPRFLHRSQVLLVKDRVRPGHMIGQVRATDADATDPNKMIIYSLENDGLGKFKVDQKTGFSFISIMLHYI